MESLPDFSAARHPRSRRIDLLRILQRHTRRFPAPRLRDRSQVDIEVRKILRRPDACRMATNPIDKSLGHSNPLRDPLEGRRNGPRI